MVTTTIKNNLEDKIIFGEDKLPTVCRIYTIPFESGNSIEDDTYLYIKDRYSFEQIDEKLFLSYLNNSGKKYGDISICKVKKLAYGPRGIQADSGQNLKVSSSSSTESVLENTGETLIKTISFSDFVKIGNKSKGFKVCILYCNSFSAPIVKIKSIYQYNIDLKKFKYGFDICNLSEGKLKYNSHYSKIDIEEKKVKKSFGIANYTIDRMVSDIASKVPDEYIETDKNGLVTLYKNFDTGISLENGIIYFKNHPIANHITNNNNYRLDHKDRNHDFEINYYNIDGYKDTIFVIIHDDTDAVTLFLYKNKVYYAGYYCFNAYVASCYDFIDYDENMIIDLLKEKGLNCAFNCEVFKPVVTCYSTCTIGGSGTEVNSIATNTQNRKNSSQTEKDGIIYYNDGLTSAEIDIKSNSIINFASSYYTRDDCYIRTIFGVPVRKVTNIKKGEK